MVNEVEFLEGMVPDRTRVLGIDLHPLSIGDILILKRLRSPALGYAGDFTYRLLQEAVIVCSRPFAEACAWLNSPWLPLLIAFWHYRISAFGIRRVHLAHSINVMDDHVIKAYRNRPFAMPNSESEGTVEMNSPQELILLSAMMERFHQPFDVAINFSWSMAHWLYGCSAEKTGSVSLTTKQGIDDARRMADEAVERISEEKKAAILATLRDSIKGRNN